MGKVSYKKGTIIHGTDSVASSIEIILSGNVRIFDDYRSVKVPSGGVIGVLETPGSPYSFNYEALSDDVVLFDYAYAKNSDIERVIASNPKIIPNILNSVLVTYLDTWQNYQKLVKETESMYRFMGEAYAAYKDLCERYNVPVSSVIEDMDELQPYTPEENVPAWQLQYFNAVRNLAPEIKNQLLSSSVYTGLGIIMNCIDATGALMNLIQNAVDYLSDMASRAILGDGDLFDLFSNLLFQASRNPFSDTTTIEAAVSRIIIYISDSPYVDKISADERINEYKKTRQDIEEAVVEEASFEVEKDAYEALDRSCDTIMAYAECEPEEMESFAGLLDEYRLMSDRNATDDSARKLRKLISDRFYDIYQRAFFKSLSDKHIPTPVKMFFCFGYMDENICGMNNAAILFEMINDMPADKEGRVMTIYDWFKRIYDGKEQPSKNEFDLDYPAFLREQKNNGYISASDEKKLLADRVEKVKFEMENMFKLANRVTFGRISTFCPVLSEHDIIRPLRSIRLTPERVHEAIRTITDIDYNCFRRGVMYSNPEIGINQEYLSKEVLPNVILMPNVGSRGSLWQETAGSRKDTPGRMLISIFPTENVDDIMLRLAGEFKWELCKRIQGVRWNDVTDPSLTADYCDYLQFFKKNRDLSNDVKEKLKLQLKRAKNNYREAYVMDYIQWIKFESQGSPRLNKVARSILIKYAPFPAPILNSIGSNPMYKELIEKRNVKLAQRRHTLELICQKVKAGGFEVPEEILAELAFLDR